ncbi:hypothetical protein GIB67_013761, partial [Kingdonia uniflora]
MGLNPHMDQSVFPLLMQNRVSRLQVKHDQKWVEVKPKDGGIIVNIGDLQIFLNDLYQSVEHRVMENSSRDPRVSIGVFFRPEKSEDGDYNRPLAKLVTPEKLALYQKFNMGEVRKLVKSNDSRLIHNQIRVYPNRRLNANNII